MTRCRDYYNGYTFEVRERKERRGERESEREGRVHSLNLRGYYTNLARLQWVHLGGAGERREGARETKERKRRDTVTVSPTLLATSYCMDFTVFCVCKQSGHALRNAIIKT